MPLLLTLSVATLSAQDKWSYELGLGGSLNSGNVNNIGFKTYGLIERNDSILAFNANCTYLYTEEKHVTTNQGINGDIKFDIHQYDRWSPFFASEFTSNHFKGYNFKISFLVGAKYRIFTNPGKCDYSISTALVGDYVNYYVENPLADTLDGVVTRFSVRGKIKQRIGDNTSLVHTTFYQPAVKDLGDYIITSVTKVENKLHKNIFLDLIFNYEYRSVVPEERSKYDISTEVAVRLKF